LERKRIVPTEGTPGEGRRVKKKLCKAGTSRRKLPPRRGVWQKVCTTKKGGKKGHRKKKYNICPRMLMKCTKEKRPLKKNASRSKRRNCRKTDVKAKH